MIKKILLITVIVFTFVACEKNDNIKVSSNPEKVKQENSIEAKTTEEDKAETKTFKTNDLAETNNFTLQIKKVNTNYKEQYLDIAEGNKIIRLDLEYNNKTDSIAYLSEFTMKTKDNRNAKEVFSANYTASYEISPNSKSDLSLFYEIPKDTKEVILYYQHGTLLNKTLQFNIKL